MFSASHLECRVTLDLRALDRISLHSTAISLTPFTPASSHDLTQILDIIPIHFNIELISYLNAGSQSPQISLRLLESFIEDLKVWGKSIRGGK